MRRMRVEKSHPEIAFDIFDLAQKRRQRRPARGIDRLSRSGLFAPQIHSVIGRVLADEIDFAHTLGHESANLGQHRFGRAAAMTAAHLRDDTKTAGMIAALGDF